MINFYTGVNNAVVTNRYVVTDKSIGINFSVVPHFYVFSEVSKCPDKYIITIGGCFGDINWLLNSCQLLLNDFLVFCQQCSKCGVRIRNPDECSFYRLL